MKITRKLTTALSLILSALLLVSSAGAEDSSALLTEMEKAKSKALSYEKGNNSYLAYKELVKYADLASELADSGSIKKAEADIAAGWRDSLEFTPEVYLGDSSDSGIFIGSDGAFLPGSSAVKLNIPFGIDAEDYFHLIPATEEELFVLVSLEVSNEYTLRQIAFGKKDDYLSKFLRQLSRIEGRVYLSFCPAINTRDYNFTLSDSFKNAFRQVAILCDRYSPDTKTVYTLGDVRAPGWDTVSEFYPGDEYADAFGVELSHTYNRSYVPSAEAAYDSRGEYYDPILSVKNMVREMEKVSEKELPLVIAGCSFPWDGTAAVPDFKSEMERFYTLMPAVFPNLEAVLYSNVSSSAGITNLRQNPEALAVYENCLSLPWYSGTTPKKITSVSKIHLGESIPVIFSFGGKYSGAGYTVYFDSEILTEDRITFTEGEHSLIFYITEEKFITRIAYDITVASTGEFSAIMSEAEHDYNGNGIMDFGDVEMLSGYIAKWITDLGGMETDINGDGRTNILDLSALRVKISAPVSN